MRHRDDLFRTCIARAYEEYASIVARNAPFVLITGLCLTLLLIVGCLQLDNNNDYLNLWMYQGTRLDGEKAFYEKHFGGIFRSQAVVVSSTDGGNIATREGLDAMLHAAQYNDEESVQAIKIDVLNRSCGLADLCDRPAVPVVYQPYSTDRQWAWMEGQFMSYGYQYMANCTKQRGGTSIHPNGMQNYTAPEEDLQYGWGVDQFPCSRATGLDCFAEGNFDYPRPLRQVDEWADYLMWNSLKEECLHDFEGSVSEDLAAAFRRSGSVEEEEVEDVASGTAAQARAGLERTLAAFWTFGYRWRKSYKDMTDNEILLHLETAMDWSGKDSDPSSCVLEGAPCCLNWAGRKVDNDLTFASVDFDQDDQDDSGKLISIKYLISTGKNLPPDHPTFISHMAEKYGVEDSEVREAVHLEWEQAFIDMEEQNFAKRPGTKFAPGAEFEGVHVDFFSSRSGNDVMERGNQVEKHLVVIAYSVMVIFAAIAMGHWKPTQPLSTLVYSRILLSLGGVLVILMSTLASFGFISQAKVTLTPLQVNIVPFLSLGIGIDDMFILTYTLLHTTDFPMDPEARMRETLLRSGPSVLVTTMANAGCFLVGAGIPIDVIRVFSYHMGIQMIFHLIFLHLIFVPMMYWDTKRVAACRADIVLFKINKDNIVPESEFNKGNLMSKFIHQVYAPVLMKRSVKVVVVVISLVLSATMLWYGLNYTDSGLSMSTLAATDSYQKSFLIVWEENIEADVVTLVTKGVDLPTYQETLLDIQEEVQNVPYVSDTIMVRDSSWLANGATSFLGVDAEPVPPSEFNSSFKEWISSAGISSVNSFSCEDRDGNRVECSKYDPTTTVIAASTQTIYLQNQADVDNIVDAIVLMRKAVDDTDSTGGTFVYGQSFVLYSQYLYTKDSFIYILGMGAAIVAVVVGILGGSVVLSLLICMCIILVVFQVFGCLAAINVNINGFSIINLCVMMGFVVEFTAHIGRAFLFATGTGNERVATALDELLWPTFAGAMTTFLAVLPLAFSKFHFFHNYYFQLFAIMVALGLFAGIALLPVLMSWAQPDNSMKRRFECHWWLPHFSPRRRRFWNSSDSRSVHARFASF